MMGMSFKYGKFGCPNLKWHNLISSSPAIEIAHWGNLTSLLTIEGISSRI